MSNFTTSHFPLESSKFIKNNFLWLFYYSVTKGSFYVNVRYQTSYTYQSCPIASLMIKLIQMNLLCLHVCHKLRPTPCLHSYIPIYSRLVLFKRFPHTSSTLKNSLSNLLILSQRLVTMSVSLHTQTVLRCLIIQVLNTKSLLPKYLIQSFHFCT